MTLASLRRRAEFDALLARRPLLRSAHFAVHHVANTDHPASAVRTSDLSTAPAQELSTSVDKSSAETRRLGCMIPKRHVRRSVTRNLIRRQIRSSMSRCEAHLKAGDWLVRVTQGWPVSAWPSAASAALTAAVRAELELLLARLTGAVVR